MYFSLLSMELVHLFPKKIKMKGLVVSGALFQFKKEMEREF